MFHWLYWLYWLFVSDMFGRMNDGPVLRAYPLTHEALWPTDLFNQGLGWVVIARFKSAGRRVEAGIFLLDVFCLGAKLAVYEDCDVGDYRQRIRDHYKSSFPMVSADPCCARKLVEQAVEYARGLGFAPHPDYKQAARAFRELRTEQCAAQWTFGHQGKPFYRRGPRETEDQARRIVGHLEQHCGPGNYDYLVMLGAAEDINRALGY
jgi:hypothetical protein